MASMRSMLQRVMTAAGRRPKLRFLLTCPEDSGVQMEEIVSGLRSRLPGCALDCRGIEEARGCASRYDAVFVVLDKAGQTLPQQLITSLRCEKWRYHLMLTARQLVQEPSGVSFWRFADRGHLVDQLWDLMYERVRDIRRISRSFCSRLRS